MKNNIKSCKVEGCKNIPGKLQGNICPMHRSRMFRSGSYNLLPESPVFKFGKPHITKSGYMRININGIRILEHRYIMEQFLKRPLSESETIHHINGNKTDNRIENLELMKNGYEHTRTYHMHEIMPKTEPITIHNIVDRIYSVEKFIYCFCGNTIKANGLCSKHYAWAWRHKIL